MNRKNLNPLVIPGIIFSSFIILSSCTDNNWPQFRGPEASMTATGKTLPTEWGKDKNIVWTYDFEGDSWSSPIIWGDKVFISSAVGVKAEPLGIFEPRPEPRPEVTDTSRAGRERPQGSPPAAAETRTGPPVPPVPQAPPPPPPPDTSYLQEIYRWEVTCLDLNTGEVIWKSTAFEGSPRKGINRNGSSYANETPVTDGKRIFAYFGNIGMFCFDMEGKLLWKKDLGAFQTLREWGTGSSPVVYQDMVYQQVDNEENSFIVALDAATGDEIWRESRDEKTTYSSPVIWKNNVRTELVTTGKTARSYDLKTGEILWQLNLGGEMSIPSPVPNKDYIYLSNAGGRETPGTLLAVKAGATGDITPVAGDNPPDKVDNTHAEGDNSPAEDDNPDVRGERSDTWILWSNLEAGTGNPTPLVYEGLIYIVAGRGGNVSCFDAANGQLVYKEKAENVAGCWASPWAAGDHICLVDEKGLTTIIKAGEKFEVVTQNHLDDRFWASVGIAGNKYIFKGREKIYCIGL
jgi:outer membrane protein assembly factor BamB